jgi:hypothetical protein
VNPRDLATQLAVLTVVEDTVKERKDTLRAALRTAMDEAGADATRAEINDDRVAKVSLITPQAKASVADQDAFTAWVEENYPTEVITTKAVRSSFQDAIFKEFEIAGDNVIHTKTGELVPGIKASKGNAYVSTRFEPEGRAKVMDALRNGTLQLDISQPLQLESGQA